MQLLKYKNMDKTVKKEFLALIHEKLNENLKL
jgi:hypothetical protein